MPKLSEFLQPVMEAAEKKRVEITFSMPGDLEVVADGNMLGSVIRNLTANAVKYTPRGGKVTISARSAAGNFVEISVKDNGIGMGKDLLDKLFRLDEHTNRKGTEGEPSTGLGLIISKDFIEKHGGLLRVESEEGKGSSFYFTVPEKIPGYNLSGQ